MKLLLAVIAIALSLPAQRSAVFQRSVVWNQEMEVNGTAVTLMRVKDSPTFTVLVRTSKIADMAILTVFYESTYLGSPVLLSQYATAPIGSMFVTSMADKEFTIEPDKVRFVRVKLVQSVMEQEFYSLGVKGEK